MHGNYAKAKELLFRNLTVLQDERISGRMDLGLKKTALKCFVLLFRSEVRSLSIGSLGQRFGLSSGQIREIVNPMILSGEISARWNGEKLERIENQRNAIFNAVDRLQENLETITLNNLRLLQYSTKSNFK